MLIPEDRRILEVLYELEFDPFPGDRHSPGRRGPISPVPLSLIAAATLPQARYSRMPPTLARLRYLERLGLVRESDTHRNPDGGMVYMRDGRFIHTDCEIDQEHNATTYRVYAGSRDELQQARTRRADELVGDREKVSDATYTEAWNDALFDVLPEFRRFEFCCYGEREEPGGQSLPARPSEFCRAFSLTEQGAALAHELFRESHGCAGKPAADEWEALARLERDIPPLDRANDEWRKNDDAAEIDGVKTRTLANYRTKGAATPDGRFGRDKYGRIWRREGTRNSHPWYLLSTLKNSRTRLPQNRR